MRSTWCSDHGPVCSLEGLQGSVLVEYINYNISAGQGPRVSLKSQKNTAGKEYMHVSGYY
jgi:hypothetical protein